AKQAGATKAGVLGYAVPQSSQCADGWEKSFQEYPEAGVEVAFKDSSLSYGTTDFSVQVSKMKDAGVDFIITCLDNTGVVNLAKELKKQGVDAKQFLPNAYDQELLDEFGDLFEGSVASVSFIPLEFEDKPQGMQDYLEWIEKAGATPNENSIVGWLNAALLVEGLRQAGPEFTQQKVIDAINADINWTADGFLTGVDWTNAHNQRSDISCTPIVKVENSKFVPVKGPDGKPFVCFDIPSKSLEPVTR
ncbi:MAG: ABC transporter substrate-binding protein, partial [Actinomycetota bacterium]